MTTTSYPITDRLTELLRTSDLISDPDGRHILSHQMANHVADTHDSEEAIEYLLIGVGWSS